MGTDGDFAVVVSSLRTGTPQSVGLRPTPLKRGKGKRLSDFVRPPLKGGTTTRLSLRVERSEAEWKRRIPQCRFPLLFLLLPLFPFWLKRGGGLCPTEYLNAVFHFVVVVAVAVSLM
jgi:hypothetical protein